MRRDSQLSIARPLRTRTMARVALLMVAAFTATVSGLDFVGDATSGTGKLWALLVAGSNGYYNYRHQADICHAYHVLHNHGIPDERIVVMMFDDIAYDSSNPTPGVIINHPEGKNVYPGVPKDYTGSDVTPENFLRVLQGRADMVNDTKGSHKVINSGPEDHVFVYFADHGSPGLIAFPSDELHAADLKKTIEEMHRNKQYGKMVIYIEACESGSMFHNVLPDDVNVYATTAADPYESSYACYWDDYRQTYLGDLYSVNWMEDSDKENLKKESLEKQYDIVKKETNTSNVMEYGDLKMGTLKLSQFQGGKPTKSKVARKMPFDAVDSREVPLAILRKKIAAAAPEDREDLEKQLQDLLSKRAFLDSRVAAIARVATLEDRVRAQVLLKGRFSFRGEYDHVCYKAAVQYFGRRCFNLSNNPYALGKIRLLYNLCARGYPLVDIRAAMDAVCTHSQVTGTL